jgi:hypothetical protein
MLVGPPDESNNRRVIGGEQLRDDKRRLIAIPGSVALSNAMSGWSASRVKQRCRVIDGKPCIAYGQCEKRDQAAAIPLDIMLLCVLLYVAYPLNLGNLEEMMQERGVFVDHSSIHR